MAPPGVWRVPLAVPTEAEQGEHRGPDVPVAEAEKEAPASSKTGSTPSSPSERVHFATSPAAQQQQKFSNKRRGMVGGMNTSPSPSSSLSPASLVCHMRYILPTILLLAVVASAAEERVTLREPRLRQQPTERPVQARHHHRRQQRDPREPNLFGSAALPRDLDEDARSNHHGFSNSTVLQHAQRRRGANSTIGMKSK